MIKNCGAHLYRGDARHCDHYWCSKCGACWDVGDPDDRPECLELSREFTRFYLPLIIMATGAAWLMSATLAAVVLVVLYYLAEADAAERGAF